MKKAYIFLLSFVLTTACTETNETVNVESGEYTRTIFLQTDETGSISTKAIDGVGVFTSRYDPEPDNDDGEVVDPPLLNDYIYIHSTSDNTKWVRYNIRRDLPSCNGCDGFQFKIRKNEDGSYTLLDGLNENGNPKGEVTFNEGEQIYFSSIANEIWEGTSEEASPISGQSVLIRDANKNKELYRSDKDYDISDLVTGNNGLNDELLMKRKCSAFRIYFMFTELDAPSLTLPGTGGEGITEVYSISPNDFENKTGLQYSQWSGKLYIGPCFSDYYNVNTGETSYKDNNNAGYYVTNEQKYSAFTSVTYSRTEGTVTQTFSGYGVSTANSKYLITPYDTDNSNAFTAYVFIKDNTNNPEDDSGSKYFSYSWNDIPEFNVTQVIVLVYDVDELNKVFQHASENTSNMMTTRSNYWEKPQQLDIRPTKVFYIQN